MEACRDFGTEQAGEKNVESLFSGKMKCIYLENLALSWVSSDLSGMVAESSDLDQRKDSTRKVPEMKWQKVVSYR